MLSFVQCLLKETVSILVIRNIKPLTCSRNIWLFSVKQYLVVILYNLEVVFLTTYPFGRMYMTFEYSFLNYCLYRMQNKCICKDNQISWFCAIRTIKLFTNKANILISAMQSGYFIGQQNIRTFTFSFIPPQNKKEESLFFSYRSK